MMYKLNSLNPQGSCHGRHLLCPCHCPDSLPFRISLHPSRSASGRGPHSVWECHPIPDRLPFWCQHWRLCWILSTPSAKRPSFLGPGFGPPSTQRNLPSPASKEWARLPGNYSEFHCSNEKSSSRCVVSSIFLKNKKWWNNALAWL